MNDRPRRACTATPRTLFAGIAAAVHPVLVNAASPLYNENISLPGTVLLLACFAGAWVAHFRAFSFVARAGRPSAASVRPVEVAKLLPQKIGGSNYLAVREADLVGFPGNR